MKGEELGIKKKEGGEKEENRERETEKDGYKKTERGRAAERWNQTDTKKIETVKERRQGQDKGGGGQ